MKPAVVLLAFETSGKSGSVAILRENGGLLSCDVVLLSHEAGSARTLAPAIARLISQSGMEMRSLSAIALLTGPGSFTGLRVGVATAKAMAYALRIPIVEVDTLDVIARQCPVTSPSVYAILDAYRGQVFAAEYAIKSVGEFPLVEKISSTEILDIDVLLNRAMQQRGGVGMIDLCGLGCDRIRKYLSDPEIQSEVLVATCANRIRWIDGTETSPNAETVARLGLEKLSAGVFLDPFTVLPRYYRGSAAEEVAAKSKL